MFSFKSIHDSKIEIIKITVILLIAHIYKCNFQENLKCGNNDWFINTFGLICGIIIYNLFWSRLIKNIPIEEKKSYTICKNILKYSFSLVSQYLVINFFNEKFEIETNQFIYIISILFVFNLISNFIIKDVKSTTYKNYSKERLVFNSLSNTLFIILIDSIIYNKEASLNLGSITSYLVGYLLYYCIKVKLTL